MNYRIKNNCSGSIFAHNFDEDDSTWIGDSAVASKLALRAGYLHSGDSDLITKLVEITKLFRMTKGFTIELWDGASWKAHCNHVEYEENGL